jgi:hypothetical protein
MMMALAPKNGEYRADRSRIYSREAFARFNQLSPEQQEGWLRRAQGNCDKAVDLLFAELLRDFEAQIRAELKSGHGENSI